jgi:hypothetical protein
MKHIIIIFILNASSICSMAQESKTASTVNNVKAEQPQIEKTSEQENAHNIKYNLPNIYIADSDSIHLPEMNVYGQPIYSLYWPIYYGPFSTWQLHEGLNLSLGTSVFASFGHNAPHGAGFTQNFSAIYAQPLNNKLSLSVGGYFNNMYWIHNNYHDAGLTAVLGYKFNDHWEGYIYGQKSLVNKSIPYPLYDINNIGDRIGTAIKYNVNQNLFFQVSFEKDWSRR